MIVTCLFSILWTPSRCLISADSTPVTVMSPVKAKTVPASRDDIMICSAGSKSLKMGPGSLKLSSRPAQAVGRRIVFSLCRLVPVSGLSEISCKLQTPSRFKSRYYSRARTSSTTSTNWPKVKEGSGRASSGIEIRNTISNTRMAT